MSEIDPTATEPRDPETVEMHECPTCETLYEDYERDAYGGKCPTCGTDLASVACVQDGDGTLRVAGRTD